MPFMFGRMMKMAQQAVLEQECSDANPSSMASTASCDVTAADATASPFTPTRTRTTSTMPALAPSPQEAAQSWIASLQESSKPYRSEPSTTTTTSSRPLPPGASLIFALRNVSDWLVDYVESGRWQADLSWLLSTVVGPVLVALLATSVVVWLCHKLYRTWVCPYTADEWHQQALQALAPTMHLTTKTSATTTTTTTSRTARRQHRERRRAEKTAEALWKRALATDPTCDAAWTSLSALYVYRLERPDLALALLKEYPSNNDLSPALHAIRNDALALQQGHRAMVQSDLAETEYLTVLAAVARGS